MKTVSISFLLSFGFGAGMLLDAHAANTLPSPNQGRLAGNSPNGVVRLEIGTRGANYREWLKIATEADELGRSI